MNEVMTSPARRLLARTPASIAVRLAPGGTDTLGMLVARLLALPAVELLVWARVAPNLVTTASVAFFFSGLMAWLGGSEFWAGLGIASGAVLDFADGMVARRTDRCSLAGYRYDYIMDRLKTTGLFVCWALLDGRVGVQLLAAIATGVLYGREIVTWLLPIRQVSTLLGHRPWRVVFGRAETPAMELLRNDPWQLVLFGLGLAFVPSVASTLLGYYLLTLAIDTFVFLRSFVSVGILKVPGNGGLLLPGPEGRVKSFVWRAWRMATGRSAT